MSDLIERIKADREAGTPGPWQVSGVRSTREIHGHQIDARELAGVAVVTYSDATLEEHRGSLSDGRRIARVPEMESRILADAEALKAADAAHETGDDVIRAANTLSLMLCGDLAMTKTAIETAVKRFLSARSEWDERMTAYRKARRGEA